MIASITMAEKGGFQPFTTHNLIHDENVASDERTLPERIVAILESAGDFMKVKEIAERVAWTGYVVGEPTGFGMCSTTSASTNCTPSLVRPTAGWWAWHWGLGIRNELRGYWCSVRRTGPIPWPQAFEASSAASWNWQLRPGGSPRA